MADEQPINQNPSTDTPPSGQIPMPPEPAPDEQISHIGPIIGVLIIVLVFILGGLYLWGQSLMNGPAGGQSQVTPRQIPNNEPETTRAQADANIMGTVSSSDSLDAIQADLDSTDLNSLDTGLSQVDTEVNSSLSDQ